MPPDPPSMTRGLQTKFRFSIQKTAIKRTIFICFFFQNFLWGMPPDLLSMIRGLKTNFMVLWQKNVSKVHIFESIFLILSGGACFRKRHKGLLPIFHAILFVQNEIFHDY